MKIVIKTNFPFTIILLAIFGSPFCCISQELTNEFQDKSHFSQTFDAQRSYRVYLPEGYENGKNYPVTYFFHGWGGRHFKDDNALLEYEMIGELVDKYQVILVMWDGRIIESEHRPYNIGCPEQVIFQVQMKDYFLELVAHIDSTYNTFTNREHRAIIGYSMGGIMSFFIAGKYPDMISVAVNMTGSPEFNIGYPNNNTLYSLRHTFANLKDLKIRFHNSSAGELSGQNREVYKGALWQGGMDIEYWEFPGGHKVDERGETDVFEMAMNFVDKAYKKPKIRNDQWSHYDLYSNYKVWDYAVFSNKTTSGFTYLRNVSKDGFGFHSRKWLPIAPPLDNLTATIATAAIYEPGAKYQIQQYQQRDGKVKSTTKKATNKGKLNFELDGNGHEIGIYKNGGNPKLTYVGYSLENDKRLIRVGEENKLIVQLANLGEELDKSKKITLTIKSTDRSVTTDKETYSLLPVSFGSRLINTEPIILRCNKQAPNDAEPSVVKITLTISYDSLVFNEEFDVPVFFDVPQFENLTIDDGVLVKNGVFGLGNGDGEVSPGEQVMVYANGYRTQLFYDDPYIKVLEENQNAENLTAKWSCDGTTISSIIKIAENCPDNYEIKILAKYETKDFMPITRRCFWGFVNLKVKSIKK